MKKYEFIYAFEITRKIIFDVKYYTLGNNKSPYFATSASKFNQPKTDWEEGGQAQERLLMGGPARAFFNKWDKYHLKDITDMKVFEELINDIEVLKANYNYIEEKADFQPNDIYFWEKKELSMKKLKKVV